MINYDNSARFCGDSGTCWFSVAKLFRLGSQAASERSRCAPRRALVDSNFLVLMKLMWSWWSWWSWWHECSWCEVDVKVAQSLTMTWPHAQSRDDTWRCNSSRTPEAKSPPVTPRPASGAKAPPSKVEQCGAMWNNVGQCGTMWEWTCQCRWKRFDALWFIIK